MTSKEEASIPNFGVRVDEVKYIDRPGVYAVIENEDEQIAVIKTGTGYFLPGGGMDPGETEAEALKREIMEETGYQVLSSVELGEATEYIKAYREEKYFRIHSTFFKVQLGSKIGEGVEKDSRLVWLCREEALKLLVRPGQVWAIENLAKE
jgi:8-oxo-dGTP diphosphatase